jgi:hypothetical protein
MFPLLLQVQSQTDYKEIIPLIISHLESLTENRDQFFPSLSSEMYDWVRNPFVEFSPNSQNLLSLQEEEQLTELQCDRTLMIKFSEVSPDVFCIAIRKVYPVISAKAVNMLLQFSTSYLCERAFSCLTNIKSKERNRLLSVEEELRVFVKNSAKNSTFVQKETIPSVTLKVNLILTLDVNFIFMFK